MEPLSTHRLGVRFVRDILLPHKLFASLFSGRFQGVYFWLAWGCNTVLETHGRHKIRQWHLAASYVIGKCIGNEQCAICNCRWQWSLTIAIGHSKLQLQWQMTIANSNDQLQVAPCRCMRPLHSLRPKAIALGDGKLQRGRGKLQLLWLSLWCCRPNHCT